MNLKRPLLILLLTFPCTTMAEWVEYSTMANGDVYFFDNARVQKDGNLVNVWNRIRYKTSVMGASSYQSLLRIDCAGLSETTLQSTFYTDGNWANPAMATDTMTKPKVSIGANSATRRLADILCEQSLCSLVSRRLRTSKKNARATFVTRASISVNDFQLPEIL